MPDTPDLTLYAAIRRANQYRHEAANWRKAAPRSDFPTVCLTLAGEADDLADFVIEGMNEAAQ